MSICKEELSSQNRKRQPTRERGRTDLNNIQREPRPTKPKEVLVFGSNKELIPYFTRWFLSADEGPHNISQPLCGGEGERGGEGK